MPESTFNIHPVGDRIAVRRIEAAEKTRGGLLIPDVAKEKPVEAHVLAVGRGRVLESGARVEPTVRVGDRVLLTKYGGTELEHDGKPFVMVPESDILAVLED